MFLINLFPICINFGCRIHRTRFVSIPFLILMVITYLKYFKYFFIFKTVFYPFSLLLNTYNKLICNLFQEN